MKRRLISRWFPASTASISAAFLLGCAGKSYSPLEAMRPATSAAGAIASAPEVVTLPHEPSPVIGLDNVDTDPMLPATVTNVARPPVATLSFGKGYIPLRVWSDRCGAQKPERMAAGSATAFRVRTKSGWCKLTIGTRLAHWNGIAIWLGFAPQIVRGEPHIHALDAEKTLMPLAEPTEFLALPRRTIVLDPGHGGSDSGTQDAQHHLEKHYALDWALRTERLLTNAGWKVFLTRRTDVDLSLAERIAVADRVKADLFISLHFNSTFPQKQALGIETYCLTPGGMPSTLARGFADDERMIYPNNAFDAANVAWAFRLQGGLIDHTRSQDDGVKRARFMGVLRYQNRAAILIEGGFLSNPFDAERIREPAYRETLAMGIVQALK